MNHWEWPSGKIWTMGVRLSTFFWAVICTLHFILRLITQWCTLRALHWPKKQRSFLVFLLSFVGGGTIYGSWLCWVCLCIVNTRGISYLPICFNHLFDWLKWTVLSFRPWWLHLIDGGKMQIYSCVLHDSQVVKINAKPPALVSHNLRAILWCQTA